jgi:hypothetical protein
MSEFPEVASGHRHTGCRAELVGIDFVQNHEPRDAVQRRPKPNRVVATNRTIADSAVTTSASIVAARRELAINNRRSPIQSARIPPGSCPQA